MSTGPTPGWYHAEGDPPNTERYWDGTQWTEGPRPVGGSDPAADPATSPLGGPTFGAAGSPSGLPGPAMGQPAMGGAGGMAVYPEASKATTALVLSILGILCCGPLSAVGAYMGRAEQQAIRSGLRDPKNQGMATAAFVVGLIGLVIWALVVLIILIGSAAGN